MKQLRKITGILAILVVFLLFRAIRDQSAGLTDPFNFLSRTDRLSSSTASGFRSRRSLSFNLDREADSELNNALLLAKTDVQDAKLRQSIAMLRNAQAGNPIAKDLDKKRIRVTFGDTNTDGANAVYIPGFLISNGRIIINRDLKNQSPVVIAAILAHEGTHAQLISFLRPNSVEQEYRCYLAQARVWKETRAQLKMSEQENLEDSTYKPNFENAYALEIAQMDRKNAFSRIQKDYQQVGINLPRAGR